MVALHLRTGGDDRAAADLWLRIGESYRRAADLPAAADALTRARALAPEDPLMLSTLALVLDAAGRRDHQDAAGSGR